MALAFVYELIESLALIVFEDLCIIKRHPPVVQIGLLAEHTPAWLGTDGQAKASMVTRPRAASWDGL